MFNYYFQHFQNKHQDQGYHCRNKYNFPIDGVNEQQDQTDYDCKSRNNQQAFHKIPVAL